MNADLERDPRRDAWEPERELGDASPCRSSWRCGRSAARRGSASAAPWCGSSRTSRPAPRCGACSDSRPDRRTCPWWRSPRSSQARNSTFGALSAAFGRRGTAPSPGTESRMSLNERCPPAERWTSRDFVVVREGGLEPPRPLGHWNLNPARLPIPPLARVSGGDRSALLRSSSSPPVTCAAVALKGFERRLERMVEGTFARIFRSGLRPVELGRRLVREMDDNRSVDVRGRTAGAQPLHRRAVARPTSSSFAEVAESLERELAEAAREHARDEGYVFMGPVSVHLEAVRAPAHRRRSRSSGRMREGEGGVGRRLARCCPPASGSRWASRSSPSVAARSPRSCWPTPT